MAERYDISDKLIHFTNGASLDEAFNKLIAIMRDGRLIAGTKMIRGAYRCVCFTEAPRAAFADVFVRRFPFTRYSQFGLMFDKKWIYARGGRPVIYQPESDFHLLPEKLAWRHVRFELVEEPVIDFTWEREWRILCDDLPFTPAETHVVVPNEEWSGALRRVHHTDQDMVVELYSTVMEREIAELSREPFHWHIVTLQ